MGFEQKRFSGRRTCVATAILAGIGGVSVAAPVWAQQQPVAQPEASTGSEPEASAGVEEVVVTAQRRSERMQDVPISIGAVSGAQLTAIGVDSTQALSQVVPGLLLTQEGAAGLIYLRGVGSNTGFVNNEGSVAVYVDDVYIAGALANVFTLNNIDRVEVLKGPQGTLFGRNATGGVIQVITRDPSQTPELEAQVGYGNYDTVSGSLYATGGITDKLAADIALMGSNQGSGWGRNVTTGEPTFRDRNYSARTKFLLDITDDLSVKLSLDFARDVISGFDQRAPDGVTDISGNRSPGFYNANTNSPGFDIVQQGGASVKIDYDLDEVRLVSITAYRQLSGSDGDDQDAGPINLVDARLFENTHNVSQEIQAMAPKDSTIQWTVGAYYYNFVAAYTPVQIAGLAEEALPDSQINIFSRATTESGSLYGQATKEVAADTNLTLGYRYSLEGQHLSSNETNPVLGSVSGNIAQNQDSTANTWRLALDHKFSADILGYISYNRGFKSGGFNLVAPTSPGYRPEKIDAYEIGLKSEFFEHRVQLNVAGFYYNYSNIQENISTVGGAFVINAAKAQVLGSDVDIKIAATDHLDINLDGTYLNSTFASFPTAQAYFPIGAGTMAVPFNAVGKTTPQAPTFSGNIGATYTMPTEIGDFAATAGVSYNSGYSFTVDNLVLQPSYTLVNASLKWTSSSGTYTASIWGANLNDAHYLAQGNEVPAFGQAVTPAAPRTYGFTVGVKFGGAGAEAESPTAYSLPAVVPVTPVAPHSYLVFFDFNKSDLTPQATAIVDQAAKNTGPAKVTRIDVTGHTDTVGSDAYNMRLSRRRAESVAAQLEKDGIPANEIAIYAKGKRDLLVPTGDGVREPQNRRVQIVYSAEGAAPNS
jgi:iron complex outermembrane receptor protein